MRVEVPILVEKHPGGTCTLTPAVPGAMDIVSHAASEEEALAALLAALRPRLERVGEAAVRRLAAPAAHELRRLHLPLRCRRRSGRHVPLSIPLPCIVRAPERGAAEAMIPLLGIFREIPEGEEIDAVVLDEARWAFPAGTEEEAAEEITGAEEALRIVGLDVRPEPPAAAGRAEPPTGPLSEVGTDLTADARGRPATAFGREEEVAEVLRALGGAPPASVLLVGPTGAGKTAIVHEVARRMARREAGTALEGASLVYLSGNRIVAGTHFLGDWEERCQGLAEDARERRAILFVDDLCELVEAGRVGEEGAGAGRFFAPYVARGEVTLIAETTTERLTRARSLDPSFVEMLRRVEVSPMDPARTRDALDRLAAALGRKHGVRFQPLALDAVTDLSRRFLAGQANPGRAAAIVERIAAEGPSGAGERTVGRAEVIEAFSRDTGLLEGILREDVAVERASLVRDLEEAIVGQPAAARALADAVLLLKSGLADPARPVACYLFVGPTGVGKTEAARVLAGRLTGDPERLLRFDMSEYQDPAGPGRLIGAEGDLVRRVRARPVAVVLLDEIERAHPTVIDALLSVLGEGRLLDAGGRVADFRNTIVILTSNLGAEDARGLGFGAGTAGAERHLGAVEEFFRPEFLNRIDRIVPFEPLSPAAVERIARREIDDVIRREGLLRRNVSLRIDPAVVSFLARVGYHPRLGARPLKREVERRLLTPLARHLVRRGGRANVEIEIYRAPGTDELRIAARDLAPPTTDVREFADPTPAHSDAALADETARVRRRLADLLDRWLFREGAAGAIEAIEDQARRLDAEASNLAREVAAGAGEEKTRAALAGRLSALDRAATRLEIDLLLRAVRPEPLPVLEISEETPGAVPGAAARCLRDVLLAWARERGLGVEEAPPKGRSPGRLITLRFADPAHAAVLAIERGMHEFALDLPDPRLRGARVAVGPQPPAIVACRYAGTPAPHAFAPRTGLRQPLLATLADPLLPPAALERFLLGAWRVEAAGG